MTKGGPNEDQHGKFLDCVVWAQKAEFAPLLAHLELQGLST